MKNRKSLTTVLFLALIVACFQINSLAQVNSDSGVASISSAGSSVRWDLKTAFGRKLNHGGTRRRISPGMQSGASPSP